MKVPAAVSEAGVEGQVQIRLDINADGTVSEVRITSGLSVEADAACVAAWLGTSCRPARRGNTPVGVANMPHACVFRAVN